MIISEILSIIISPVLLSIYFKAPCQLFLESKLLNFDTLNDPKRIIICCQIFKYKLKITRAMKFWTFLPFALCNGKPILATETSDFNYGLLNNNHERMRQRRAISCDKQEIKSFLNSQMNQCERSNIDHPVCVEWSSKELERKCGGSFNCIETDWTITTNGWGQYFGYSSKLVKVI